MDRFGLRIRVQSIRTKLSSNSGGLIATERDPEMRITGRVDPDHTRLKLPCNSMGSRDILGEQSSSEPIRGVIGFRDGFSVRGELVDDNDWAEDFFSDDR